MIFENLEKQYWSLVTTCDIGEDINPLNLAAEKDIFFRNLEHGNEYNPVFQYRNVDNTPHIHEFQQLKENFENFPIFIAQDYCQQIHKQVEWIEKFKNRDSDFSSWLSNLYQRPSAAHIAYAKDIIAKLTPLQENNEEIFHGDIQLFFQESLENFGFKDWSVDFFDMPSAAKIKRTHKKVLLNPNQQFSTPQLQRLVVHELGTHVLRFENGQKQTYNLFKYGFDDYLETEEGLAVYSERKSGLLTSADELKYCLRLIACDLAHDSSFSKIYNTIAPHTDPEQAFSITTRVKRGLTDTSMPGGYTKDQVYLSGFLKVQDLPKNDLKTLYLGKIGIQNLQDITKIDNLNHNVIIPSWILD